jgi:hypothetical protein
MDYRKDNVPCVPTEGPAPRLSDHELIRLDAAVPRSGPTPSTSRPRGR